MKKTIILTAALLVSVMAAASKKTGLRRDPCRPPVKFAVGIHTGTDVGGAVPWPVKDGLGKNDKINATPHLKPELGLSWTTVFNKRWSMTLESTYKTVALDARAWVENQTFVDRDNDPWVWVSFRGAALMQMSFPMVEFPLYVRCALGKRGRYNRLLLGGYYARIFDSKFLTSPYQGMLFNVVDGKPDYDNPKGIISPDDPYTQDFSDAMSRWDAGLMMGYERRLFSPRLLLSGRVSMGFNDIFQADKKYLAYNMLHMRGTLTVSYLFIKR